MTISFAKLIGSKTWVNTAENTWLNHFRYVSGQKSTPTFLKEGCHLNIKVAIILIRSIDL